VQSVTRGILRLNQYNEACLAHAGDISSLDPSLNFLEIFLLRFGWDPSCVGMTKRKEDDKKKRR
jgi:hypothetical protein